MYHSLRVCCSYLWASVARININFLNNDEQGLMQLPRIVYTREVRARYFHHYPYFSSIYENSMHC
jgi:hypothetical protein